MRAPWIRLGIVAAASVGIAGLAFAAGPATVSPGSLEQFSVIADRCPSFSWGAVRGVERYELVITRVAEGPGGEASGIVAAPLLRREIPGAALSWTPALAECPAAGGRYAWSVRAVGERVADQDRAWSEARLFTIRAVPSVAEVEAALALLRRYAVAGGELAKGGVEPRAELTADDEGASGAPGGRPPDAAATSLPGVAAIRGEQSEPAGVTYGVHGVSESSTDWSFGVIGETTAGSGEVFGLGGISTSPSGAGVAAFNAAGGPDLALIDFGGNTYITESGLDRPSAGAETFEISNTGGGTMKLLIDGFEAVTSVTDSDTLGALTCSDGQLAKWNHGASAWQCAVDSDTNSDTLAGLLCGQGQLAKWNGSLWHCADDIDTLGALVCASGQLAKWNGLAWSCAAVLTVGSGLVLDGNEINIDPTAFSTRFSVLDDVGGVGIHSSIAIGTDGLALISYYDESNHDLKVAHCENVACTSATISTLDSAGVVGSYTSIAIGTDGLGLISYYAGGLLPYLPADLKVAHCANTACTAADTITTLDSTGDVGKFTSIAIGTDGLGLISYYDGGNGDLKVAHCSNTTCSSATLSILDSTGDVGSHTSIAIGADGLGLISYFDHVLGNEGDLKVAHCANAACTSADTITTVDDGVSTDVGTYTSIVIGSDGLGLISYHEGTDPGSGALKVAHCDDPTCSSATISWLDSEGFRPGQHTSIVIATDGLGLISYYEDVSNEIRVARCHNTACTNATIATVDDRVAGEGGYNSIAIGADGRGLISYYSDSPRELRVAHLGIGVP